MINSLGNRKQIWPTGLCLLHDIYNQMAFFSPVAWTHILAIGTFSLEICTMSFKFLFVDY